MNFRWFIQLCSVYILILRRDFEDAQAAQRQRLWGVGIALFALGFSCLLAIEFLVLRALLAIYASCITYLFLRTLYLSYIAEDNCLFVRLVLELLRRVSRWIFPDVDLLEHVSLPCDHPFQRIQPHSWFHGTSTVGAYMWILWAIADRLKLKGETPEFRWKPAPFLVARRTLNSPIDRCERPVQSSVQECPFLGRHLGQVAQGHNLGLDGLNLDQINFGLDLLWGIHHEA